MYYAILGLIFLLSGCIQKHSDSHELMHVRDIPVQQIDLRDSLLVTSTVKEWNRIGWYVFHKYEDMYDMKRSEIEVTVLRCFYNFTKTKVICWVLMKLPNAVTIRTYNRENASVNMMCPSGPDTVYITHELIGMRDAEDDIWILYPLDAFGVSCVTDTSTVLDYMEDYYFSKMKSDNVFVVREYLDPYYGGLVRYDLEDQARKYGLHDEDSEVILKDYGYNLSDDEFWDKSLLWQKGSRLPGLYMFQTVGNVTPSDPNGERILPAIEIPSFIIELYSDDGDTAKNADN